jgi:hypothetical protein
MSDEADKQRDNALDRAIEKYLRGLIAEGFTKDQAVARLKARAKEASVHHRRSQLKLVK